MDASERESERFDAEAVARQPWPLRMWHDQRFAMTAISAAFLLLIGVVITGSVEVPAGTGPGPPRRSSRSPTQVNHALALIGLDGSSTDQRLAARVAKEHQGYVFAVIKMFAAVDHHEPTTAVNAIDSAEVDPVFDAMQVTIYAAAARHEADSLAQVASARRTGRIVLGLDIATLCAGVCLVLVAAVSVTRSQRRLRSQRDTNRHLALHDSLTGLPNRALFQDRTERALLMARRSGHQVAVMFVDLNRFKDINDTLGHHYGDLLLKQVAERFTTTLRSEDSVARIGGDEFAVLLGSTSRDEAAAAADRLNEALGESFNVRDIILDVDASIGIAIAGPDADVDTLLRHADVAMYEAKSQHAPCAFYELTRDDHTVARLALLGDLRRAITRNELVLHYQPKIDAKTGNLNSVEALVRWHHPTRGLLPPDAFIPIAETTAVIHPLTAEILRQALQQARVWFDQGRAIAIAVNISARSLHDLDFPAHVQEQLDAAGVPSTLLSLELTESAIMTDPGRALQVLQALHAMGIGLSIDDFGTEYSSMAYLKQLPVRELKIDRSFVTGLTTEPEDVVLVQTAVDLAHNLGLNVVAEGVEDAATQHVLADMGCDQIQGYFISRPVTAKAFALWLDKQPAPVPPAPAPATGGGTRDRSGRQVDADTAS